eukprot:TRINITY_DN6370_c0_g1_i1.p1 TRINITY_DN6370_c0_g1~~TRINITY_DN6370_c0_g1_i1.p1  ORF type:complete len:732 (-),score=119.31 TRINITY_DN6370_c0_g1_i1:90-2285(-)
MGLKAMWRSLVKGEPNGGSGNAAPIPKDEPLECVIKEAKRNEHLQNLGMKRNKSIRKSIAKKLKRKEKRDEHSDSVSVSESIKDKENQKNSRNKSSVPSSEVQIETRTSIGAKIEGGKKIEVIKVDPKKESGTLVGETQPLPAHIQNDVPRKMDKLRRSIRHSMRKRKESGVELSKAQKWQMDEAAVRSGTCQYYVKYLGCCEVFESRGMQVCEAAVNTLKQQRRRTIRGTLYVSGDSIRVVDDDTKGLVLDQTIEKVSFCAPDRNFEKGFSYICRDGTTRRWMCHAFMAVGDSGERLSHAVGCAFGICLENKQKRDKVNVSVNYDAKESSFTRMGSFRVGTMTERIADPQAMKPTETPKTVTEQNENIYAVERPRPPELMYQRQASFRGLGQLSGNTPFKRGSKGHMSLRISDLPSNKERRVGSLCDSPILEDVELPPSNLEDFSSANAMCQQLTKGIDLLSNDDPFSLTSEVATMSGTSGTSTPAMMAETSSNYSMSPPPSLLQPIKLHKLPETPDSDHNPWDNVPDQPKSPAPKSDVMAYYNRPNSNASSYDNPTLPYFLNNSQSHSLPVNPLIQQINTMTPPSQFKSLPQTQVNSFSHSTHAADQWIGSISNTPNSKMFDFDFDPKMSSFVSSPPNIHVDLQPISKSNGTSSGFNSPTSTNSGTSGLHTNEVWQANIQNSILEDPFDAEWATIAARNSSVVSEKNVNQNSNPFLQTDSAVKAFELEL